MTFWTPREKQCGERSEKFERPKSLAFEDSQQRIQKKNGAVTRLSKTMQQEHSRTTSLEGFTSTTPTRLRFFPLLQSRLKRQNRALILRSRSPETDRPRHLTR